MAQSLEEYQAQSARAYQPAQDAIYSQLGALDSQLNTTTDKINRNYAQQQSQLESQRNQAAEASSMAAAGSGGSFGGAGNLARRKYYEQTFVPAQTQLQTNQANELEQARQNIENQRTSLNSQLANLQAQAQQQALQQYWAEQEAERNRQAQISAAKASNPYSYLPDGYGNTNGLKNWNFGNGYYVQEFVDQAGNRYAKYYGHGDQEMDAGDFVWETNLSGTPWNIWNDIWDNGVNTYGINSNDITKLNSNKSRSGGGGW